MLAQGKREVWGMIPNDQPLRKQIIQRMLDGLDDINAVSQFNKWEPDFIGSIIEQFEKKGDLSDRQCEILERIYDKVR